MESLDQGTEISWKPGKIRLGVHRNRPVDQPCRRDGTGELLPRVQTGGEAILWHTGAGPGRAPHPHFVRKAGFSVGVGPKGHPWQGREISRPPSLRENTADVKKLSSRRAGAKGSKCPSVWSEGSP